MPDNQCKTSSPSKYASVIPLLQLRARLHVIKQSLQAIKAATSKCYAVLSHPTDASKPSCRPQLAALSNHLIRNAVRTMDSQLDLLNLPNEIQTRIYRFAVPSNQDITVQWTTSKSISECAQPLLNEPALAATSKSIRQDVLTSFYGGNTFDFGASHLEPSRALGVWRKALGDRAKMLRSIKFSMKIQLAKPITVASKDLRLGKGQIDMWTAEFHIAIAEDGAIDIEQWLPRLKCEVEGDSAAEAKNILGAGAGEDENDAHHPLERCLCVLDDFIKPAEIDGHRLLDLAWACYMIARRVNKPDKCEACGMLTFEKQLTEPDIVKSLNGKPIPKSWAVPQFDFMVPAKEGKELMGKGDVELSEIESG